MNEKIPQTRHEGSEESEGIEQKIAAVTSWYDLLDLFEKDENELQGSQQRYTATEVHNLLNKAEARIVSQSDRPNMSMIDFAAKEITRTAGLRERAIKLLAQKFGVES